MTKPYRYLLLRYTMICSLAQGRHLQKVDAMKEEEAPPLPHDQAIQVFWYLGLLIYVGMVMYLAHR